ncbi:phosphonate C-P lyase system protein PhnL [Bacillaceae bacterium SAOS 7]|nr:phosphonate C-P lyase system protein PhnL [Bacillaceae bacterium SAOS 7]
MNKILSVEHLSKSFTLHHLNKHINGIHDIDFYVNEGEFVGLTGKSGSGKSTVLKCIYRTYLSNRGSITYHSKQYGLVDLTQLGEREVVELRKQEIGYVSQFLKTMPRTTAREMVTEALLETGYEEEFAYRETERILAHFELDEELWDSYPTTFSGGEKLRLNIARAMVKRPRLLLLDEPTASLDQASKEKVKQLLEQLKQEGTTMLGIFHDLEFMQDLCDREYKMKDGKLVDTKVSAAN